MQMASKKRLNTQRASRVNKLTCRGEISRESGARISNSGLSCKAKGVRFQFHELPQLGTHTWAFILPHASYLCFPRRQILEIHNEFACVLHFQLLCQAEHRKGLRRIRETKAAKSLMVFCTPRGTRKLRAFTKVLSVFVPSCILNESWNSRVRTLGSVVFSPALKYFTLCFWLEPWVQSNQLRNEANFQSSLLYYAHLLLSFELFYSAKHLRAGRWKPVQN